MNKYWYKLVRIFYDGEWKLSDYPLCVIAKNEQDAVAAINERIEDEFSDNETIDKFFTPPRKFDTEPEMRAAARKEYEEIIAQESKVSAQKYISS